MGQLEGKERFPYPSGAEKQVGVGQAKLRRCPVRRAGELHGTLQRRDGQGAWITSTAPRVVAFRN